MNCCQRLLRGVAGLVRAVASPSQWADPAVILARRGACQACTDRRGPQCRRCGCLVRAKTRLKEETCPAGRWPGDPRANETPLSGDTTDGR